MKVNLYYFSGTGNSLYITKRIQKTFLEEDRSHQAAVIPIQSVELNERITDDSDVIGIIYPTYFLDAPDIVKDFAGKLDIERASYVFLYANYGLTMGNALSSMDKILGPHRVNGHFDVALPDNSIVFETPKEKIPAMLREGKKTIEKHAQQIYEQTKTNKSRVSLRHKINASIMKSVSKGILGFNRMKVDSEACTGCGLCNQVCTMKNITGGADGKPVFGSNCSMCFACIHFCPKEAVTFKRMNKKKKNYRYSHPEISVKGIIEARKN